MNISTGLVCASGSLRLAGSAFRGLLLTYGVLLLTLSTASAQSEVARVSAINGRVTVQRGTETITPEMGASIRDHDSIRSTSGGITITFADKSRVQLGPESDVVIEGRTTSATKLTLVHGIVRTSGTWRSRHDVFEIDTKNAIVIAHTGKVDTSYSSESDRNEYPGCQKITDVAVLQGAAEVRNAASNSDTQLNAGYVSTVPCNQNPLPPGPLGVNDVQTLSDTKTGYFSFISSFFESGPPNIEKQDIDGVIQDLHDGDDAGVPVVNPQASIAMAPIVRAGIGRTIRPVVRR